MKKGTSLIDLMISIGIITVLFGGVYLVYFSVETAITNVGVRTAAAAVIANEIEMVRGLPYGSVGTVGGVPAGVVPQTQTVTYGPYTFALQTTVLNIDDPYDTSPSSTPVADYKLVDITATCPFCSDPVSVEITTTVASRNLTAGTNYGSIFVNVINADGVGVPTATVEVVNASVTPNIDVIDTANASGVLELIGVPTSTQGYQVFVSKAGYSSAQTYPVGGAGNPDPIQPNITVASQTVSAVTLSIDLLGSLTVSTTDDTCHPVGGEPLSIQGSKTIGANPDVLKFSTTTGTNSQGSLVLPDMEWDGYTLTLNDASMDIAGTMPQIGTTITLDPGAARNFQFILAPAANPALLAGVSDAATGAGIPQAGVSLSRSGFLETLTTDHATYGQDDWSAAGEYASQNGEIAVTVPGTLTLLADASGTYSTSTAGWLISDTIDVGGTSSTFNAFSWTPGPGNEPPDTSLSFQVAANNDNATWNFVGPDGTPGTYFTSPGPLPASLAGNRYFRYEVFMSTQDPDATPDLTGVSLDFTANCVPPAQVLFTGLAQGTYTLDATAPDYAESSTTVSIGPGFQSSTIELTHL